MIFRKAVHSLDESTHSKSSYTVSEDPSSHKQECTTKLTQLPLAQ